MHASCVIQVCFFRCTDVVVGCSSAKAVVGGPPMVTNEVVQDLKQNIYKLEEEVSKLLQLKIRYTSGGRSCLSTATGFSNRL